LNRYQLEIRVTPRPGLLDPEGKAIHHALESLGHADVESVSVGKLITVDLAATSEADAVEAGRRMCQRLLANPVTEDFEVRLGAGAVEGTEA
jgi:phosphoribosylformylglycinamidine synthase subunit PurS